MRSRGRSFHLRLKTLSSQPTVGGEGAPKDGPGHCTELGEATHLRAGSVEAGELQKKKPGVHDRILGAEGSVTL